jgi:hypothetical protein
MILLIFALMWWATSCTSYTGAVYRGYNWSVSPYGWNNPYLGPIWNQPWYFSNPYIITPRYNIPRIQPQQPSRYERRISVGERPSRRSSDDMYPRRTPSIPRVGSRPSQQNSQPSRIQNKPTSELKPKWYSPQQPTNSNITPMVQPQFRYQSSEGFGINGTGAFQRGY